ncbi:MAG: zinc-ribbon domain-containing protein, partial [Elusimicrobia bacterium]|nr:zinc-ribbon domain-containing protein [Elusimicrobiota bacterium]
ARFCPACGASLAARACPKCHAQTPPGAKFCSSCGSPL